MRAAAVRLAFGEIGQDTHTELNAGVTPPAPREFDARRARDTAASTPADGEKGDCLVTTNDTAAEDTGFSRVITRLERIIVVSLIAMMMLVVALATVDLAWLIVRDIITPPVVLLEVHEILDLFAFFLLILIGLELLVTIKAYLRSNVVHVEIVLEVALIAVARKVILLDLEKYDWTSVLTIAALVLSLAGALALGGWTRRPVGWSARTRL